MIKCPYCGKSHFIINSAISTLVYVPTIISKGKVEQQSNPNKTTYNCTCLECHKDFETHEDILNKDDSPIQCDNNTGYVGNSKTIANKVDNISLNGNATAYLLKTEPHIGTPCLVCGEGVEIKDFNDTPKICDKCKEAILRVRSWKRE